MTRKLLPVHNRAERRHAEAGVSVIELLASLLLLAVIVGGLIPVLSITQQSWDQARLRGDMVHNTRFAIDTLMATIRAAQVFTTLTATDIIFTYSFGDKVTLRAVSYHLDAATNELQFKRLPTDPFQPFAGAFRSMTVTCYDAANVLIDCSSIGSFRSVQISLVAMDPSGRVPDMTTTARVFVQAP